MLEHYVSRGPHRPPGASLCPAGTPLSIADYEGSIHKEVGVVAPQADGLDLDNVEHLRQSRLTRWQSPPLPTRTR